MSGGTPRKFSEKIAIMERKQNEDVNQFEDIMREVRSITSTGETPSAGVPIASQLHPPAVWHMGGSLPNVAQLHHYPNGAGWPQWEQQRSSHSPQRSRSPDAAGAHYHPYRMMPRPGDRVPPLHPHYVPYPPPQQTLQPPEPWNQMNRARSDPAIHQIQGGQMPPIYHQMGPPMPLPHHMQPGPSGLPPGAIPPQMSMGHPQSMTSPLQSPHHMVAQPFQYTNGSPMQSPLGSPMGSSMMLDERGTPIMELSPPGVQDQEAGSLPNLQQMPPQCYHATVGQRHSTGQCGRLVPGPSLTPESQSAPTSPANNLDPTQQPQWPAARTFSNSPESMDIPRVVLTNPDGAHGQHLDCFNDLQHLTLDSTDMSLLCNGDVRQEPQIL